MPNLVVSDLKPEQQELLTKWGVQDFPVSDLNTDALRALPAEKLQALFYHQSSGRVALQKLLYNLIWQAYTLIKSGIREPIDGNMRTFWYQDVKAPLSRLGLLQGDKQALVALMSSEEQEDPDETLNKAPELIAEFAGQKHASTSAYLCGQMTIAFDEYVRHHIFKFNEWGIADDGVNDRFIGESRPEVVFAAEKHGFAAFVRKIHDTYGCSALCLGGQPKYISTEYFSDDLSKKVVPGSKELLILACVDYDPAGSIIAEQFQRQLAFFGFTKSRLKNLITLDIYTPLEVENYKYQLSTKKKTQQTELERWIEKTGGVNGEPYGLESDDIPRSRIEERVKVAIAAYTSS